MEDPQKLITLAESLEGVAQYLRGTASRYAADQTVPTPEQVRTATLRAAEVLGRAPVQRLLRSYGVSAADHLSDHQRRPFLNDLQRAVVDFVLDRKRHTLADPVPPAPPPAPEPEGGLFAGGEPDTDEIARIFASVFGVDPSSVQVYTMPGDPSATLSDSGLFGRIFNFNEKGRDPQP